MTQNYQMWKIFEENITSSDGSSYDYVSRIEEFKTSGVEEFLKSGLVVNVVQPHTFAPIDQVYLDHNMIKLLKEQHKHKVKQKHKHKDQLLHG